ncbi:hypothetical protein DM01DRAFT_1332741 [Hesseltinella vesiculosa]|uniref:Uncharacterized protein n=1 Tax=Hesseltinella vesiculosa TaxID=101127 RepID=A0A1X2GT37_9FUNG|nr:hypothetical protein DM01DRAFT_1332741 [Hesseltinella vesiculosa]
MPKIVFDSDEEFTFDEPEAPAQPVNNQHHDSSDSDDDQAPEAVSTAVAKESILSKTKAQKEAATKSDQISKEKRRRRDQQLKEQKQGSKRERKEQKRKRQQSEDDEQDEHTSDESEQENDNGESKRLPQSLLDDFKSAPRTHLTAEDFEALQAEEEAKLASKLAARQKKRKMEDRGRMVGEYTVKVLNQRPKVARANHSLTNLKQTKLHRKAVHRENAVLGGSTGRVGKAALVFQRSSQK